MADGFEDQSCITCFIAFRVPAGFTAWRREDCVSFYCPNGHSMSYSKNDRPLEIMRRERDLLAQRIAQRDDEIKRQREMREAAEREAAVARGQVTKLKKRAIGGVCPCCNRTFSALRKHMACKHPAFAAEGVESNVVKLKGRA